MHPVFELILNPTAGPAGFNLVSVGFYFVIALCVVGALGGSVLRTLLSTWLVLFAAGFGAFVAARQTWLQWYPPEVVSCGRDFYGMIENFPLQRLVPMIFKGSGDCTKVDWTFLGGSIANWSFVAFVCIALLMLAIRWRDGWFKTTDTHSSPLAD